jgi:hypothetical protein
MTHQPDKKSHLKEEAQKWEMKLAALGMPSELGEDPGAKALRQLHESRGELINAEEKILRAIQRYFIDRTGNIHGEHLKVSQEIARAVGVDPEEMPVDLIESVRRDMMELGHALSVIAQKISEARQMMSLSPKYFARDIVREYKQALAGSHSADPEIVEAMAQKIATEYTGF